MYRPYAPSEYLRRLIDREIGVTFEGEDLPENRCMDCIHFERQEDILRSDHLVPLCKNTECPEFGEYVDPHKCHSCVMFDRKVN